VFLLDIFLREMYLNGNQWLNGGFLGLVFGNLRILSLFVFGTHSILIGSVVRVGVDIVVVDRCGGIFVFLLVLFFFLFLSVSKGEFLFENSLLIVGRIQRNEVVLRVGGLTQ